MAAAEEHVEEFLPDSDDLSRQFVESVHERFDSALRGFLMNKLRNLADAEDFAQEVYVRFARVENPRNIQSDRAFMFTTATNLLRDRSRRLATKLDKASISSDDVTLECSSNDPAQRVQDAEQLRLAREALDQVSDKCRQAFWMSRIEGRTYADIAAEMGVSVSMVEKHISAALAKLREVLD